MTEAPKGFLSRLKEKVDEKLVEKIADGAVWLVLLASLALLVFARQWMVDEWVCIKKPWCEVRGWSLGVLLAAAVVATTTAIYFGLKWYRTRRELHVLKTRAIVAQAAAGAEAAAVRAKAPVPFWNITVEDRRLQLRWIIRRPPKEWLHWRNVRSTVSPGAVHEVLDGPFHAAPGCNAPLEETYDGVLRTDSPTLSERCPVCGQQVFRPRRSETGFGNAVVYVWAMRAQALEELQRMERNGSPFDADVNLTLESPAYWKSMRPPH